MLCDLHQLDAAQGGQDVSRVVYFKRGSHPWTTVTVLAAVLLAAVDEILNIRVAQHSQGILHQTTGFFLQQVDLESAWDLSTVVSASYSLHRSWSAITEV